MRRSVLIFAALLVTANAWADDFPALLDALEAAGTPMRRGFDQGIRAFDEVGNRVVGMIGAADTWDPYGTPALREAVIARWRKEWRQAGAAMLRGAERLEPLPGHIAVSTTGIDQEREVSDIRTPFLLNNGVLYEIGTMDGRFPPMAFMLGDQSGIWAPPVKALDGFSFVVRETGSPAWALVDGARFSHDFASATLQFAGHGWQAERLDFPAAFRPALFSRLKLSNTDSHTRTVEIDFFARINIRPDWRTAGQYAEQNDLDVIEASDGWVRAWDKNLARSMILVGADRAVDDVKVEAPTATLTHRITVPAGGTVELTFLVLAGLTPGDAGATDVFRDLSHRFDVELAAARQRMQKKISSGVTFSCSDKKLTEAFTLAKANLALLTADCRPHFPDVYLMAAVPVYPRLFACDSCISVPGAMAAGFAAEARGTLACLASQAGAHGALVPHESATDATLIGPANAQETPQFIATCLRYLRWSGDRRFADQHYPLLKAALDAQRVKFDQNGNGYPEGPALIETRGMGPEKVDAACWQCAALAALAEIATISGMAKEADQFAQEAATLRWAIRRDWWMPHAAMWADSLHAEGGTQSDGLWSVVFPLLTGVADPDQAQLTLAGLQKGWVNQWGGVHTRTADISRQGSGVVTTELFANAAFAHGQPDMGLRLLRIAVEAPSQDRMPGSFTAMIPPGGSDFMQLWSAGPFLEGIVEGLAGIRPDAFHQRAEFHPRLPSGLDWFQLEHVRIGRHELTLELRRDGAGSVATLGVREGPGPLSGTIVSPSSDVQAMLDEKTLPVQHTSSADGTRNASIVSGDLLPGSRLVVRSPSAATQ